ncbi:MAG: NAD+ diphosphatase [Candidatus Azotimanducaceae bacterium]|jgi:NAD+ diphosphatase
MDWQNINIADDFISATAPAPGTASSTESAEDIAHSFHIVISDGEILSPNNSQSPWRPLTQNEYRWLGCEELSVHFLGTAAGIPIYANEIDPDAEEPEDYTYNKLWSFLGQLNDATFNLLGRSKQIVEWNQNHKYCGQCGGATTIENSDRSRSCTICNIHFYPRLSPSIIVLVTKGEEVLLAKNAHARANFYSTLAGFIEPGESIEEAVHREVMEEVGIKIKNLKYFSSQSWPFPNSLMLGFHAEYDSGDIVLQEEEIADAQWFHYSDMPNKPALVSISGWLVEDFVERTTSN